MPSDDRSLASMRDLNRHSTDQPFVQRELFRFEPGAQPGSNSTAERCNILQRQQIML